MRSTTSAISHAQPIGRSPSSAIQTMPNSDALLEAAADHRLVAVLEDVQRDELGGEGHQTEREEREVPDQGHSCEV